MKIYQFITVKVLDDQDIFKNENNMNLKCCSWSLFIVIILTTYCVFANASLLPTFDVWHSFCV